jgi:ssDNA-binding Zn-finger/Zn-ribbon topoisomerase 1
VKQASPKTSQRAAAALTGLRAAATLQGFVCHATTWHSVSAKILLECASGHRFERAAYGVLYKESGCPECNRANIAAKFHKLVAARGGQCLNDGGFLGGAAIHRIRCENGHEWTPEGRSVLAGYWCPRCAGKPTISTRNRKRQSTV